MTSGFRNSSGVDFDSLFDPYVQGTKPSSCGFRTSDGSDLVNRYAPIIFGSKGPDVGYRTSGGVDVSNLWAASGTASYSLPINGGTYSANAFTRGAAQVDFNLKNDGTYTVVRSGTGITTATLASGTWLPSGGSVSDYSTIFTATQSGSTQGGGTNSVVNGAVSNSALTTTRTLSAKSLAPLTGDLANANATVVVKIYKTGVLVSTTTFSLVTNANGN